MRKKYAILLVILTIIVVGCSSFIIGYTCNSGNQGTTDTVLIPSFNIEENAPIYILGHTKPDLDTVFSAIGLANLLKEYGLNVIPAVSDEICPEAENILALYGLKQPLQLSDVSGKNIIIVDYSEIEHGPKGLEDANILAIVDHHEPGDIKSKKPIFILEEPMGSTSTNVYSLYKLGGKEIDIDTATLLLYAILDDTKNMTSSTTTDVDRIAVAELKKNAGISDTDELFLIISVFESAYEGMTDEEILHSKEKLYTMGNHTLTIGYVFVMGEENMASMKKRMLDTMQKIYPSQSVDHMYVVLLDMENYKSELLYYGDNIEKYVLKAFPSDSSGRILFDKLAGRKGTIVPPLISVYEKEDFS